MKKRVSSGVSYEDLAAYSRAVRVNNTIEISGTTSLDGKQVVGKGDAYKQGCFIFQKMQITLEQMGASLEDIVRTRIYTVDIRHSDGLIKAHNEYFKDIKPASTLIEVSRLVHPDMLVEIEATAIIDHDE